MTSSLLTLSLVFAAAMPIAIPSRPGASPETDVLERIGALPARYNGRLSTLEEIARDLFAYCSGQEQLALQKDPHRALKALLARMANPLDFSLAPPIPVPDSVAPMLGFSAHGLKALGSTRGRTHLLPFAAVAQGTAQLPQRLWRNAGRDAPPLMETRQVIDRVDMWWNALDYTCAVPGPGGAYDWRPVRLSDDPACEGAELFQDLIQAWLSRDPEEVERRLDEYEVWLGANMARKAPVDFDVPEGWTPLGVTPEEPRYYFRDGPDAARRVASFHIEPDRAASVGIVFFSGPVRLDDLLNTWRTDDGVPPLECFEEGERGERNPLGIERDGAVSWVPQQSSLRPATKSHAYAAAWTDHAGTWLASLFGPRSVLEEHRERFLDLVRSIRTGDRDAVLQWLPDEPCVAKTKTAPEASVAIAFVADSPLVWVARFWMMGGEARGRIPQDDSAREEMARSRIEALLWGMSVIDPEDAELAAPRVMFDPASGWFEPSKTATVPQVALSADGIRMRCEIAPYLECAEATWRTLANAIEPASPWTEETWRSGSRRFEVSGKRCLVVMRDGSGR